MGTTPGNAVNITTTGIVGFTGTAMTGSPATQYNVQVGGSTSSTLVNIAPSATSGVPLISQGASSNPIFGTAVVSGGGTGDTSFTAYSVICGGTTSTGALQNVSGLGSSGQVLTSNGASALPTWQAAGGGGTITTTVFNNSGTWTKAVGTIKVIIIGWNAGNGGSSGAKGTTGGSIGGVGGGCNGGFYFYGPSNYFNTSETVTIGSAGSGGISQTSNGGGSIVGTSGGLTSLGNLQSVNTSTPTSKTDFTVYNIDDVMPTVEAGQTGGLGNIADAVNASSGGGLNSFLCPTPGAGGGGGNTTTARMGGSGGAYLHFGSSASTLVAGSAGGIETGTANGTIGTDQVTVGGLILGGTGGGGGGGYKAIGAGTGGNGGIPGGGGGGGGGGISGIANSGPGGNGGAGRIIVMEFNT